MEMRLLGSTGMNVSPIGLGTVKFGRDQQVKYPSSFKIPDDQHVLSLLHQAKDLGINLIDTAPAYGTSQERLGKLLPNRDDWVIVSKVGEAFIDGQSYFDFSFDNTVSVVEDSLRTLKTDVLDVVLIHSDGNDVDIIQNTAVIDALNSLKERGLIKAHGMSTKTVEGGIEAANRLDMVMATCFLGYDDEKAVFEHAEKMNKGILVKKGLQSGHIQGEDGVKASMQHIFQQPAVSSMIVGTINPAHLESNVKTLQQVLSGNS